MAPVRNYSNWNRRSSDQQEQLEPYQKFFIICEGANTEVFYFRKLIDLRKRLGIHPLIDICLLEKTEEDRNLSHPKRLLSFANQQKSNPCIAFDEEWDRMIVVIDTDVFENKQNDYLQIIAEAKRHNNILAVTNPAFELFLLLHYENSYETDIQPNEVQILENKKEHGRRFIDRLFSQKSGMNSKTNSQIGNLAENVDVAIEQEKKLNQDIEQCHGTLTCNIGKIISDIRSIKAPNQP